LVSSGTISGKKILLFPASVYFLFIDERLAEFGLHLDGVVVDKYDFLGRNDKNQKSAIGDAV
jgi:hypothetical protein